VGSAALATFATVLASAVSIAISRSNAVMTFMLIVMPERDIRVKRILIPCGT
jgi:hypothetical protein